MPLPLISALTYLLIGPEKIWGLATGFFRDLVLTSSLSAWPDWLPSFLFNGLFGFLLSSKAVDSYVVLTASVVFLSSTALLITAPALPV